MYIQMKYEDYTTSRSDTWVPPGGSCRRDRLLRRRAGVLIDFDREDMRRPKQIRAEHDPMHVGRERHVWLEAVVVARQVHQLFRPQHARADEISGLLERMLRAIRYELRTK